MPWNKRNPDLVDGIVDTVAGAVRAQGIPADVITLVIPHDVIATHAVESPQHLDHVTRRGASEHHLGYPRLCVETLAGRQHGCRWTITYTQHARVTGISFYAGVILLF